MARYNKRLYFDYYRDGHYILLEIWRKVETESGGRSTGRPPRPVDPSRPAYRIADLQGLRINLQGGTETVEAPILKTTCEVTVVDYPKMETSQGYDAKGDACTLQWSGWEDEFYTMDSTEFMARVYQDNVLRWSGYLTPDTWDEDLVYGGSITLTFRDNLGHLADFDFDARGDADGLVSVQNLVEGALRKIGSQMSLGELECELMATDGTESFPATEAYVSVLALKDKTWLEALEAVLESLGLVLRYDDNNTYQLMAIRQMPQTHKRNKGPRAVKDIIFLDQSGHRSKDPVFKTIEETVSFDVSDDASLGIPTADNFGTETQDVQFRVDPNEDAPQGFGGSGPVHMLTSGPWRTDGLSSTLAFNPFLYTRDSLLKAESLEQLLDNNLYVAANVVQDTEYSRYIKYIQHLGGQRGVLKLSFGQPVSVRSGKLNYPWRGLALKSVTYGVAYVYDEPQGEDRLIWLNPKGYWGTTGTEYHIKKEYEGNSYSGELKIPFDAKEMIPGNLTLFIWRVEYKVMPDMAGPADARAIYARITDFALECKDSDVLPESDKTTTIYNENANVKHTREPLFGTADVGGLATPMMMPNLIYSADHLPLTQWFWKDAEGIQKLSVINAKQILCYHCRAMSYITGTIADNTADDPRFDDLYQWNGQQLMLISGSLDLLTGFMESAALREFELYYNLWEEEDTRTFFILGGSKLGSDDKLE